MKSLPISNAQLKKSNFIENSFFKKSEERKKKKKKQERNEKKNMP